MLPNPSFQESDSANGNIDACSTMDHDNGTEASASSSTSNAEYLRGSGVHDDVPTFDQAALESFQNHLIDRPQSGDRQDSPNHSHEHEEMMTEEGPTSDFSIHNAEPISDLEPTVEDCTASVTTITLAPYSELLLPEYSDEVPMDDYQHTSSPGKSGHGVASPDLLEDLDTESNDDTNLSSNQEGGPDVDVIFTKTDQDGMHSDLQDGQVVDSGASTHSPQSHVHSSSTPEYNTPRPGSPGRCPEPDCEDGNSRFTRDHMLTHQLVYKIKYRSGKLENGVRIGKIQNGVFSRQMDLLFHCQYCHTTFPSSTEMTEHVVAGLPHHYHSWRQTSGNKRLH
ncbi:hypothetical protein B0H15DRAFT_802275 [Mycena belliarum]|uniref:Uncharacterized protein n=1 Tax=Mycena belliarum TaxID=1033014 RepID=A0AAD6TZH8_9AGAR|nr:hypothetical protein B0H15DRAFT_802275 [Mycena belliae]